MKKKIYAAIAMLFCASGFAQVPQLLSHQGYIADSVGNGITNTLPMTFRMFNDSTGGSAILTQSFPGVSLTKGVFNVNLDVSSLSFTGQYWLETEVNGQTLAPRTRLTSAPYSLAPWSTNGTAVYYNNGNVGIGTTNPGANLSFGNSTATKKIALFENSGGNNIYGLGFESFRYSTSLLVNGNERLFIPVFGDFPNYTHVWGLTVGYGTSTGAITTDGIKPISLQILGSEKMRITADGNIGIGTNNPTSLLTVAGDGSFSGNVGSGGTVSANGLRTKNESGTMSYYDVGFYVPPAVSTGPQLIVGGGLNLGVINTTPVSDRRLKDDIHPMQGEALGRIMSLKPVSYQFKHIDGYAFDQMNPGTQEGFIADELQEVIPSAVKGEKDAVTEDGKIQPQSVSPMPIIAVLTKAIQEQQKEIDELKALVKSLAAEKNSVGNKSMGELK